MTKTWHILGAGAIGCLWAAKLEQAGYQVALILRNTERLQQFRQQGTIALSREDSQSLHPVAAETPDSHTPIERLLICTKACDSLSALKNIRHRIAPGASVLILQNGMGTQQQIADQLSEQQVWAGTTTDGAWVRSSFDIVWAGQGVTLIGPITASSGLTALPDHLPLEQLAIEADSDISLSLWRKLAINCAINPLTALLGCRNGELASDPDKRREMEQVCKEVDQLTDHLGMKLFPQGLFPKALEVTQLTANNYSSMLQDVKSQRQTEIDYITGYLCQQAALVGINVAKNHQLMNEIKKIQGSYQA